MSFLYPTFLFALLAVAIPVLIHLFSFRRYKTIYFSNVGFLKDVKKESRKKSRLKQLLLLLARVLAIIFLVLAFAQPYIPAANDTSAGTEEVIGIYVDNSFSMNALSENGQLIEQARSKAAEIGQSYPAGTQFRLFTNDMNPGHQQLLTREQLISMIAEIKPSPSVVPVSLIGTRFNMLNQMQESDGALFLISDFQRQMTDLENFSESNSSYWFMPLVPNQVNNLYIDTCWVEVPAHGLNQEETVYVTIKNNSPEDYQNLPLRLFLNDSLKSITSFSINAQDEITAALRYKNLSSGIQQGRIEITDYPFTHDNTWYISYYVEPRLRALAVFENSPQSAEGLRYISALFSGDDYVELEEMNVQSMQFSRLGEMNTIFLLQPSGLSSGFLNELSSAVSNGGSVVLFPDDSGSQNINNQILSTFGAGSVSGLDTVTQEISGIDYENRFFANVFSERKVNALLPKIDSHLKFNQPIRTDETNLLWFQNGDKALSFLPYGNGKVWIFSFPLNRKNEMFANDILFVPSIYNIVLNSLPDQKLSLVMGNEKSWLLPSAINTNREAALEMYNPETGNRFIPGITTSTRGTLIGFEGMIESAGHYQILQEGNTLASLAFNYDRKESDFRYYSAEELNQQIEQNNITRASVVEDVATDFSNVLQEIQRGQQLWKWCILMALLFLFAEALIARFWRA